ncbi:MAG: peptidoglycan-binding protein [Cyanobacteria bacterium J06621_11]
MTTNINRSGIDIEYLPTAGVELIKQFTHCQLEAYWHADGQSSQNKANIHYLIGWGCDRHKDARPVSAGDSLTQHQADELLNLYLRQVYLPTLRDLPNWSQLSENQQGALLSFAHSLDNDSAILSPRSLIGRALKYRRWYQIPSILSGYYGQNPPEHIAYRRQEEANLFVTEANQDSYIVINRSRQLALTEPALVGKDVQRLQQALVKKGFEIEIDGQFGPMTQWAIEKFQAFVGLPRNGIADVATQRILYARPLFMSRPYLIGSDVREIQSLLGRIGYAVDVNGVFNPRTFEAIIAFQNYFGLPEDGILKDRTLVKLLYWPEVMAVS